MMIHLRRDIVGYELDHEAGWEHPILGPLKAHVLGVRIPLRLALFILRRHGVTC